MKAIILNGPPRSGKDSAALAIDNALLAWNLTAIHEKFSLPNKLAFAAIMGVRLDSDFNCDHYEAHKNDKIAEFGVSFRQWQIDFSERFMKQCYGDSIFGRLLCSRIARHQDNPNLIVLVSDCGFQVEADTLYQSNMFTDILVIRTARNGTSFEGDSRSYVRLERGTEVDLENNGSLKQWRNRVITQTHDWLNRSNGPRRQGTEAVARALAASHEMKEQNNGK